MEREGCLVGARRIVCYGGSGVGGLACGSPIGEAVAAAGSSTDDKFAGCTGRRRGDFAERNDADLLGQGGRPREGYDERRDSSGGAAGGFPSDVGKLVSGPEPRPHFSGGERERAAGTVEGFAIGGNATETSGRRRVRANVTGRK